MPRLLGVHEVELRPGADSAEFERLAAEVASLPMFDGWSFQLLKGERGVRTGKYLVVFEIVSPEARDRYYPTEGQASDESGRFDKQNPETADAWERLHALMTDSDVATDYVVVAE
jgi:hypothetical protein